VAQAITDGADALGFSDHCPYPHDGVDTWDATRMTVEEARDYFDDVREAAKDAPFPVYAGFECEWAPRYESWYRDTLLGEYGADYLVLGAHWLSIGKKNIYAPTILDMADIKAYFAQTIQGIESGLYRFLAHPDLVLAEGLDWNCELAALFADLIDAAMSRKMPLEINGYGLIKPKVSSVAGKRYQYPVDEFWRMAAEKGADVICNSDAHTPDYVMQGVRNARAYAAQFSFSPLEMITPA
jgi:histidinol-phosphatase (PHP family)